MTRSIRHNTPASSEHTADILSRNPRKRIVFITFGVGSGVVLLLFVLLTHPPPKIEIQVETILVSTRVSRSRPATLQETLTNFQKTDFYRTIVDNNLFRPLGWRPPRPREPYRLLGTVIPTDRETPPQAILQIIGRNRTHTLTIGNKLDTDTTLIDIQPKQVTLEKAGEQKTLKLNTTTFLK
ncbi:MAG: hypothetical protein OXI24_03770 [Candidatus Poribacteria bacterium]|nr:hypothetical protein [Candidatus Poribacteria bacterium]